MIRVEELGERKVIELILEQLEQMPLLPVPIGDDVAAIDVGHGNLGVLKSDMLVGTSAVPRTMSLWQAARKAIVMNVSDLAAKGVQPIGLLTSIGIPRGFTDQDIQQIGKGLNDGAREYNAYVLGGDTNQASELVISCSTFGMCKKKRLIKRSGAKPGDYVATTGHFGKPASGLKILLDELSAPRTLKKNLVRACLMPNARLREGLAIAQTRAATASIDSSDGLAWSLHEISMASNVGFVINHLPIAREVNEFAKIHGLNPTTLSLYGGEEYELVVTIRPDFWRIAEDAVKNVGGSLMRIGKVTHDKGLFLTEKHQTLPIQVKGWEHFKT